MERHGHSLPPAGGLREADLFISDTIISAAIDEIVGLLEPWREVEITKTIESLDLVRHHAPARKRAFGDDTFDHAEIRAAEFSPLDQKKLVIATALRTTIESFFAERRSVLVSYRKHLRDTIKAIFELERRLSGLGDADQFSKLRAELAATRCWCEEGLSLIKLHGGKAHIKRVCAQAAIHLMKKYSTNPVTNGSPNCPYRAITAVLYKLGAGGTTLTLT
jgi:hypothetical protein